LSVSATAEEIGTGKIYMAYPKEGAFKKAVSDVANQEIVMAYIAGKLV
jgi:hypothetical protein